MNPDICLLETMIWPNGHFMSMTDDLAEMPINLKNLKMSGICVSTSIGQNGISNMISKKTQ